MNLGYLKCKKKLKVTASKSPHLPIPNAQVMGYLLQQQLQGTCTYHRNRLVAAGDSVPSLRLQVSASSPLGLLSFCLIHPATASERLAPHALRRRPHLTRTREATMTSPLGLLVPTVLVDAILDRGAEGDGGLGMLPATVDVSTSYLCCTIDVFSNSYCYQYLPLT